MNIYQYPCEEQNLFEEKSFFKQLMESQIAQQKYICKKNFITAHQFKKKSIPLIQKKIEEKFKNKNGVFIIKKKPSFQIIHENINKITKDNQFPCHISQLIKLRRKYWKQILLNRYKNFKKEYQKNLDKQMLLFKDDYNEQFDYKSKPLPTSKNTNKMYKKKVKILNMFKLRKLN